MPLHWTERQSAVARIGEEFRRRGWRLFGFREDASDPRFDIYSPASWDGVATHDAFPGAVVCVDVADSTTRQSGRPELHSQWVATPDGKYRQETVTVGTWPVFQATPMGKTWHIEVAGRIVAAGTGLARCAGWGSDWPPAVVEVVDRVEDLLRRYPQSCRPRRAARPAGAAAPRPVART